LEHVMPCNISCNISYNISCNMSCLVYLHGLSNLKIDNLIYAEISAVVTHKDETLYNFCPHDPAKVFLFKHSIFFPQIWA